MSKSRLSALVILCMVLPGLRASPQSQDDTASDTVNRAASLLTQTFDFENYFDGPAAPDPWQVSIDMTATVEKSCTIKVEYERDSTYNDKVHERKQTWHLLLSDSHPGSIRVVTANELARPKLYAIRGIDGSPPEMPVGLDEDVADEIGRLLKEAATQCQR
jgi:hypothetical protein